MNYNYKYRYNGTVDYCYQLNSMIQNNYNYNTLFSEQERTLLMITRGPSISPQRPPNSK